MRDTAQEAVGKWRGILAHFGVDESYLRNHHGPCPICGGKDRFRFDDKDGRGTYYCNSCGPGSGFDLLGGIKGWDFAQTAAEVDQVIGNVESKPIPKKRDPAPTLKNMRGKIEAPGAEVFSYLAGRKLVAVRGIFQATHDYYSDGQSLGTYDCMVCPVLTKDKKLATFHITYLKDGAKALVTSPKKLMTPRLEMKGAAIRLHGVDEQPKVLGVAEGIESALAATKITGIPCWATINTNLMEHFEPPEWVERLVVFSDCDENYAGQKAAYALAHKQAVKGLAVEVRMPSGFGNDFADQWVGICER